jgi:hypothetical protein
MRSPGCKHSICIDIVARSPIIRIKAHRINQETSTMLDARPTAKTERQPGK